MNVKDKLGKHRGQIVQIKKRKAGDCSRCTIQERIGEYAWIIEVLSTKYAINADEMTDLFRQARRAISLTPTPTAGDFEL